MVKQYKQHDICCVLSCGWFKGICSLNANILEHPVCSIFIGKYYLLAYEDGTDSVFQNVGI
jgi:hypothetical protein